MEKVVRSPGILGGLAEMINAPEPALRLLVSILLGFPLALIHRYTLFGREAVKQHIFFIACSAVIGYWNYGITVLHSTAALCVTYLIMKIIGGTGISVIITMLFNMIYLLHGYYTTCTEDYDIKWTMPQCVLTLRLIGFAFNLWDGRKPQEKLSEFQRNSALKELPSFLEVAAFSYFPGSFLIGPQFSFRRYLDYVNGRLTERESHTGIVDLPDCVGAGLRRAAVGFVYVAFFQLGTLYVSDQYLLTDEFYQLNFFKRCFLLGLWGRVNLYKYISCWLITEGVCITFGLTYNGKDDKGRPKWDGCANVKLRTFENATQFNHYILSFNINTNTWCAEYIYKRVKFLGSKLYSQFCTLAFLAVWHGLHSGYYACFFMEFIIMYFERDIATALLRNEKLQTMLKERFEIRALVWILLKIYTFVFMGYSLISFVYLKYPRYMHVYASVYYCGHIFFCSYPLWAKYVKRLIGGKRPSETRQHQE